MSRDNFACRFCGDDTSQLHVHHIGYLGAKPWDASDRMLITLCGECHEEEQLNLKSTNVSSELKQRGITSVGLEMIPKIFDKDRDWTTYEPAFHVLKMVVDDDEVWQLVNEEYQKRVMNKYINNG